MSEHTKISWTHHTWSPWRGCSHAILPDETTHIGCLNCYAEAMSKRNPRVFGRWGTSNCSTRVVAADWKQVTRWNAAAERAGEQRRIFPSMCDPFEEFDGWVLHTNGDVVVWESQTPGGNARNLNDIRTDFFDLIDETPNLTWMLLTKRPQNVWKMWSLTNDAPSRPIALLESPHPLFRSNVWLLASVSDNYTADALVPALLNCRDLVSVLGLSVEPMLGPVTLRSEWWMLDFVIIGCESGPRRRPMQIDWAVELVNQCRRAGIAVYVKQLPINGRVSTDPAEWPSDLRVQEFPR